MVQKKEQKNAPEKELSKTESHLSRCRVQNTGDQDVRELIEYSKNKREEMKVF